MNKFNRLTLCLMMLSSTLLAQAPDSLVRFNELTFYSEFERETFKRFQHKDVDIFALLMSNGSLLSDVKIKEGRDRFYDHVTIVGRETAEKKTGKRIKAIYDNLHSKFLMKYELKNRFEEIFYNGYYNCVSATALYALAFERLQIPYSIKEEPTHVYLVAYPQDERIVLETTSPLAGYYTLSDEFKQNYLQKLKDQKLISAQEYAMQDVKTLFDKYYFGQNTEVNLQQLAGLQYLNDALYKTEDKKHEEAFTQLEKAYILNPSQRIAQLLYYTGAQTFESRKEKDSTHAVLLSKLSRYTDLGVDQEMIVGEFARATQDLLFVKGKRDQYEQYYRILTRSITHQKLKDDLAYVYNYETGRLLYSQAKCKDALPYFEKTLFLKPNNLEAQGLFLASLAQTFNSKNSNQEIIKQLDDYNAKFSNLQANNHFNALRAMAYLVQFNMSYTTNKIAEGDKYKTLFESLATQYPDISINTELIGQSYSNAAVYYYRKGQVSKAKQFLSTGLKYAPNNYELITRQRMIK
ncbi:hypothetical protein [Ohtaekwangia koreensis]|nr:hypothetical protein [Ohtaekwangia koreensis]